MKCQSIVAGKFRQVQPRSQVMDGPFVKTSGGPEDLVIDGTHVRAGECDVIVYGDKGEVLDVLTPKEFVERYTKEDGSPFTFVVKKEVVDGKEYENVTKLLDLSVPQPQPPVTNANVAPGATPFTEEEIKLNAPKAE